MSNNKSLVSVILPVFNSEEYIRKSIESILNQSHSNFELLISNDASTDKSFEVIQSYSDSRIKIFDNKRNIGYLKSFNYLIEQSKGEFIAFIDSDDYCDLSKIKKQLEAFESDPELAACGTNYHRVNTNGSIVETSNSPLSSTSLMEYFEKNHDIGMAVSTVMIKRYVYEAIGGYREYFIGCAAEDYDWIRRISEIYKLEVLREPLYYYRFHKNSLTRKVNFDIRKRHIIQITYFFSQQRRTRNDNTDDLMTGDHTELNEYLYSLNRPYEEDPSLIYRKVGFESALIDKYKNSFNYLLKAISIRPFNLSNYKSLMLSLAVIFIPRSILFRVKATFGIKHISQKL